MIIRELSLEKKNLLADGFIYNHFELFTPPLRSYLIVAADGVHEYCISVGFEGEEAKLGGWLVNIPENVLRKGVIDYIFRRNKQVKRITYQNCFFSVGKAYEHNHFKIELPTNEQELYARLSSKSRYNLKREKRILSDSFGSVVYHHYLARDGEGLEIVTAFFNMKNISHHAVYSLSEEEYIQKFHVTDLYDLCVDGSTIAVILSCEQLDKVYLENMTYDLAYAKFSPGKILYDEYIRELIRKKKKSLYLGGGDLDYKKRYGSIEEKVYDGVIERSWKTQEVLWKIRGKVHCIYEVIRSRGKKNER